MSSFNSAITVPAEGLSSQPGGPDPSSSAAPRITTAGHNVKYPLGWAASEAQNFKPVLSHPRRQYKYEKLKTCTEAWPGRQKGRKQETVALSPTWESGTAPPHWGISVTSGREGRRACNLLTCHLIAFMWDSRLESIEYLWTWVRWRKGQW